MSREIVSDITMILFLVLYHADYWDVLLSRNLDVYHFLVISGLGLRSVLWRMKPFSSSHTRVSNLCGWLLYFSEVFPSPG